MLVTQTFSWPSMNWPSTTSAQQYALFQVYPLPAQQTPLQVVSTTSASISYDDSQPAVYQIRPTDGTNYGPEAGCFVINDVQCRAWLRQKIRMALADRANQVNVPVNWTDDEINTYIGEAIIEISLLFPHQSFAQIQLQPPSQQNDLQIGVRSYSLPADCYLVKSVEYCTQDGRLHLFLKEKPFRGGETTATSYMGYPKLGIMLSPLSGRFYVGNYDTYNGMINLDWDPAGDGDYLNIRYAARYSNPTSDAQLLNLQPEDMELISLRTQMKCWFRIEGADTRLSRWRSKDDGSRRDDMPTIKMSSMIKQLYDQVVNDRREQRIRTRRLVRR